MEVLYSLMQFPTSTRHKFSRSEDEQLIALVKELGEQNWMEIAARMKTRSPRQCRERYKNYLCSSIQNLPWTEEEDELLRQKVEEIGSKWTVIAQFFENRSDVNVKNHWATLKNRAKRRIRLEKEREKDSQAPPLNPQYTGPPQWSGFITPYLQQNQPTLTESSPLMNSNRAIQVPKQEDTTWSAELQSIYDDDVLFPLFCDTLRE